MSHYYFHVTDLQNLNNDFTFIFACKKHLMREWVSEWVSELSWVSESSAWVELSWVCVFQRCTILSIERWWVGEWVSEWVSEWIDVNHLSAIWVPGFGEGLSCSGLGLGSVPLRANRPRDRTSIWCCSAFHWLLWRDSYGDGVKNGHGHVVPGYPWGVNAHTKH